MGILPEEEDDSAPLLPTPFAQPAPIRANEPSLGRVALAAFRTENDVVALHNIISRPTFKPDPNFSLKQAAEKSTAFMLSPDDFLDVQSEAEFKFMEQRVQSVFNERRVMQEGGAGGVVLGMLSGALSPTIVLPFGGAGRGALAAGKTALKWSLVGATAQEAVLQLDQGAQRTGEEVALGIGTATVLGGLLGSAAGLLSKADVARFEAGLVDPHGGTSIPVAPVSAVGAQQVARPEPVRRLAGGSMEKVLQKIPFAKNPVVETIQQRSSDAASAAMQMLTHGGLKLESAGRAIASAFGGTVESRIKGYGLNLYRGLDAITEHYRQMKMQGVAKLDRRTFRAEVGRAMDRGDVSDNPAVQAAARAIRKEFDEVLKRGQEVGLFREEMDLKGSKGYLTRLYNTIMVSRDRGALAEILEQNALEHLEDFFNSRYQMLEEKKAGVRQDIEDIQLDPAGAAALRQSLEEQNRFIHDSEAGARQLQIDQANQLLREARKAKNREDIRAAEKLLEELDPKAEDVAQFRKERATIRRRFRNLDNTRQGLERRQAKVLQKMREVEAQQLATLNRLVLMSRNFLRRIDALSDEALGKEVDKFRGQIDKALDVIERGEKRLLKLQEDALPPEKQLQESDVLRTEKISLLEAQQAERRARLDALFAKQEDVLDRTELREGVQAEIDQSLGRIQQTNNRRAERLAKLRERADALSPEQVGDNVKAMEERIARMERDFVERMKKSGATDVDLKAKKADFTMRVKADAQTLINNITGETRRLVGFDVLTGPRGPELSRMLNIDPERVWNTSFGERRFEDFLDRDIENVMRAYMRTVPPDIELKRAFGSVNPFNVDENPSVPGDFVDPQGNVTPFAVRFKDEAEARHAEIDRQLKAGTLTKEQAGDAHERIARDNLRSLDNLQVAVQRLRHQRGLPKDPASWGYRAAKLLLHLQTLRLMGTVLISSLADPARAVMKFGLTRTMRDGFVPMITNLKAIRMSQREARLAGIALDPVIHGRAMGLFDEFDGLAHGTLVEKGAEYLSNRMGLIALFDHWTSAMKQFSAGVVNGKIMDSIETILDPAASGSKLKEAQDFLSNVNIDERSAKAIWKEVTSGEGGGKIEGIWVPNTERWADDGARRTYRAALAQEVDDTIVTPGLERPNWVDSSINARLLAQFRSFAMSSTAKTVMAAGQDVRAGHVVQVTNGALLSLALGALSYYTWAISVGGKAEEDMLNASPEKWADEAIDRSGLLGVLAELHKVGQEIPAIQPYLTFSGDKTTRRTGQGFAGQLLGPSYRFLFEDAAKFVAGMDDPTQSTVHSARRMTPFQNVFYLRRALVDPFEEMVGETFNLPEKRK